LHQKARINGVGSNLPFFNPATNSQPWLVSLERDVGYLGHNWLNVDTNLFRSMATVLLVVDVDDKSLECM